MNRNIWFYFLSALSLKDSLLIYDDISMPIKMFNHFLASDGDRKAYYESSTKSKKDNRETIAQLRKENKELRKELKDRLSADDHVINQAFQNKPVGLLYSR